METIRTIVEAYAQGKVPSLKKPGPEARHVRHAPSFLGAGIGGAEPRREFPYTAQSLAEVAGWTTSDGKANGKVRYILDALALIEEGIVIATTRSEPCGAF